MKKTILLPFIVLALACQSKSADQPAATTSPDATVVTDTIPSTPAGLYACAMHPEVQGEKGAECSKCGMALTEPVQ